LSKNAVHCIRHEYHIIKYNKLSVNSLRPLLGEARQVEEEGEREEGKGEGEEQEQGER
jgi:hypothetical protein